MRDGDCGAGLFGAVIGAVLILFVLGLERLARLLWSRLWSARIDDTGEPSSGAPDRESEGGPNSPG